MQDACPPALATLRLAKDPGEHWHEAAAAASSATPAIIVMSRDSLSLSRAGSASLLVGLTQPRIGPGPLALAALPVPALTRAKGAISGVNVQQT